MDPRPSKSNSKPTARRAPAETDPTQGTIVEPHRDPSGPTDTVLAPPQSSDEIGRLGSYRVLAELGRGGMGVVYRAEDPRLNRQIALKALLPELAADPRAKARFVREARAQAKVEHDHIIPLHAVEEANGVTFIVMPLLKGQTLGAALKINPRPPVSELVRIGRETAEGLAAAHAAGLVHRDIKPSNVWLEGSRRRVKILDFGLACNATGTAGASDPATPTGGFLGTPAYASPEQARNQPTDHRTDLFSLGVVLYQMATGKMAFTGPSGFDVLVAVASHDPPPAHQVVPDVPPALSALVERLMAKNPTDRPSSAEVVAEELEQIARGLVVLPVQVIPLGAVPGGSDPWADLDTTEADDEDDATIVIDRDRSRGGAPKWLWPAVAVGLVAVVGLAWWARVALKPKPRPQPEVVQTDPNLAPRPVPKISPATPDRAAAEVLLRENVRVQVRYAGGQTAQVLSEAQLLHEPFEVTAIVFATDRTLPDGFVTKTLLPALKPLKALTAITDEGHKVRWTEAEIEELARTPFRPVLADLRTEFDLTPRTAKVVAGFPALTKLTCNARSANDETLVALADATTLQALTLAAPGKQKPVTEVGWTAIARLPLRALLLNGPNKIDRRACELFAGMPHLEKIRLVGPALGEAEARALARSKTLSTVELSDCRVPDAALVHLATLPKLDGLLLSGNPITDAGLRHLYRVKQLHVLNVYGSQVTDDGAARFAVVLPECTIIWGERDGEQKVIDPAKLAQPAGGLAFDGKSTFVTVPDLNFNGQLPVTVEAWVTPATLRESHIILLGEPGGGIGIGQNGALGVGFFDGTSWQNDYARAPLKAGETVHVAAVVTKNRFVLYVNGKEAGTNEKVRLEAAPPTKAPALIGKNTPIAPRSYFHGIVHGIRVSRGVRYDREFTPAAMWNPDDATVALYRFDEGSGTALTDRSSNKYHGTIENGSWIAPKKP